MDPAEQLARLYAAGFEIQKFERYPRTLGVVRYGVIALVEPTPAGLRLVGVPGWRGLPADRIQCRFDRSRRERDAPPDRVGFRWL